MSEPLSSHEPVPSGPQSTANSAACTLFPPSFQAFALPGVDGCVIRGLISRPGVEPQHPPILLLHGHPQSHRIWHRLAPQLAADRVVVMADLRGYGDSDKPAGLPDHSNYSKRTMAADQVQVMQALGFAQFDLVGHDRGARVAHRLAADHPHAVRRLMLLDIAPTLAMYEATDMQFASAYWHWFFLIQPTPLPETLINAAPLQYLNKLMGLRHAGLSVFDPQAWAHYEQGIQNPACVHAMCEDYRAAATIDLEHDRADRAAGRKLPMPVRVLWGQHGVIQRCFDALALWRQVAEHVDGESLDCGHYIPEEAPQAVLTQIQSFLSEQQA